MANLSSSKVSAGNVLPWPFLYPQFFYFCSMPKCTESRANPHADLKNIPSCLRTSAWFVLPISLCLFVFCLPLSLISHRPHIKHELKLHPEVHCRKKLKKTSLNPADRTNVTNILKLLFIFTEAKIHVLKEMWGEQKGRHYNGKSFFFPPLTPSMSKNIRNVLFSIHTTNKN